MRLALTSGSKLGPYLIEAPAGAGGMGEVYKAKDTRLDRVVAIKVLPAATQANADLRARFEREAKAISSLNHPHICTLHDIGHEDGIDFIVMEYLEGETLSEMLKAGPLSREDLFTYAAQIADALDSAHRKGLIHRDLKPGNVIVNKDGAKLLDFGLAKLKLQPGQVDGISHVTQTTPLTGAGTIIGTLQYMSPEQLEGQEADQRSDIFAFGALLYEMAVGRPAFSGKSQASLIASVLKEEPRPLSELVSMTPPALDRLVMKCLDKDPDKRWQSAHDLRDELRWIAQAGSQAGVPAQVSSQRRIRSRLAWGLAAVASIVALVLITILVLQPEPEILVHRFTVGPQEHYNRMYWPVLSPDGKTLAFLAQDTAGTERIYVRPVHSLDANPIPGTEGANRPFWSPDSRALAFFRGNSLNKVEVSGGPVQLICEVNGADGTWGSSGIILFDGSAGDSIRQVAASGGVPTAATSMQRDSGEVFHAWPWFFPDGNRFYYQTNRDSVAGATGTEVLKVGSLDGSVDHTLGAVPSRVVYVDEEHFMYGHNGLLLLQKVDLDNYTLVGGPRPVAQQLAAYDGNGIFSISNSGSLVYQVGETVSNNRLVWVDRSGNELGTVGDPAPYRDIAISPDDKRLAYGMLNERAAADDLWVMDLTRNVSSRLTFEDRSEIWPIWSPDGTRIIYASNASGSFRIVSRQANGLGDIAEVHSVPGQTGPSQWFDENTVVASELTGEGRINIINLTDTTKSIRIGAAGSNHFSGQISPDGRFVAYMSDESGRFEVFVRELSPNGGKWQVSSAGGTEPRWSDDGSEIFFLQPPDKFYSVAVRTDRGYFEAEVPELMFQRRRDGGVIAQYRWDVSSDGRRLLIVEPLELGGDTYFVTVLNWRTELEN